MIFLGIREVLQHNRDVAELSQFLQKRCIIQAAQSGTNFVQMGHELRTQEDVLGVTTFDVWAELLEAFANQFGILVIPLRLPTRFTGSRCTANCLRSIAFISCRYESGESG